MKICDMCMMADEMNRSCVELKIDENYFHLCQKHQQDVINFITKEPEKPKRRGRPPKNSQRTASNLQ